MQYLGRQLPTWQTIALIKPITPQIPIQSYPYNLISEIQPPDPKNVNQIIFNQIIFNQIIFNQIILQPDHLQPDHLQPDHLQPDHLQPHQPWRGFSVSGPAIWNSLTQEVRQTMNNVELFKKKLKTFYMQKSNTNTS